MDEINKQWLKLIAEIQALAQCGLTFTENKFDKDRYTRLMEISAELAALSSSKSKEVIRDIFSLEKGYATPKVDVRSFVLKDNKVLLVKERSDGLWTLPGGFADVSETPSEAVIRETKEESGFDVSVIKLLALWDKLKHDHPLHWPHIYKCFFHCRYISGEAKENIEISEVDFFSLDKIPPLSTPRVTETQLKKLFQLATSQGPTVFD
ncbi:MAG: NUDIX hydrolase [Legionellales bacterium RIFCSPHIGHO2_12_FULL_35_11]|nr:MAG: NUDIX hydrolase [Legionellales bacterium RIFCSPHIGHO2_12_FULL_35_11]